ncbi:MAG: hypothetical protein ACOX4Q_06185 [Syntrophomonadales bacterium]|jgi:hypothetical protein
MSANFRYLIAAVLITFLSFNTLGCNNNTPQKKPTETQETEKPPPELEKMKKSLAELGTMLEKRRSPEVEVALEAEKGGQGNQEGGESEGDGGQQNQKGGQQAKALSREWQEEMELVRNLHREWNGLEPEAVSKGMSNATQEALETNLFDLTRAIESRQALEAQLATNQVYRYYIEAAALFKTGIPPNLERVRYHVMEASLQGVKGSWTEAQGEASQALEIWRRLSYSLNRIERQTLNQVEHSLTDLVEVVTEQSGILTSIKTEIALQNLDKLEREIKGSAGGE